MQELIVWLGTLKRCRTSPGLKPSPRDNTIGRISLTMLNRNRGQIFPLLP